MSFSFDFALDGDGEEASLPQVTAPSAAASGAASASTSAAASGRSWTLDELIDTLPSRISYSALSVPLDGLSPSGAARSVPIFRRDLFDARFQVLTHATEDDEAEEGEEKAAAGPEGQEVGAASDLLPGVYEGGLKTWECSLDLVAALDALDRARANEGAEAWKWLRGKKVLELGCGTAIPSAFLLQRLCSLEPDSSLQKENAPAEAQSKTVLHLCDFNAQVLQLVTLPNLLLAWYFSPSSASFRATQGIEFADDLVSSCGDLLLTPDFLSSFRASLSSQRIELRFDSGDWSALRPTKQDVLLSSETIYAPASLETLLDTLRRACRATPGPTEGLCERIRETSLSADTPQPAASETQAQQQGTTSLLAAKILYFGVGGGVRSFEAALHARGGWSEVKRETKSGVGRVVLSVGWAEEEREGE